MKPGFTRRLTLFALSLGAAACVEVSASGNQGSGYDATPVLADLPARVMVPTLSDVNARAQALRGATAELAASPDGERLDAAQEAWRAAREPWRRADAFRFGPVVTENLASRIDWPSADGPIIEAKIDGDAPIDAAYVDALGASAKGMMALEYLLFASEGPEDDAAVLASLEGPEAERRRLYLARLAENLEARTGELRLAWDPSFATELEAAGRGSEAFPTQKAAVDAVVNALVAASETVIARLGKPLGKASGGDPLPGAVESRRSDNSLADIEATLRGIESVYSGTYAGADGAGISDLVASRSAPLDARVGSEIGAAVEALGAIPPPLRTAVVEHPAEVEAAWNAARALKRTLAAEVVSVLGATLTFSDNDGD